MAIDKIYVRSVMLYNCSTRTAKVGIGHEKHSRDANGQFAQISITPKRSVMTTWKKKLISLPFQSILKTGEEHNWVIFYVETNPRDIF